MYVQHVHVTVFDYRVALKKVEHRPIGADGGAENDGHENDGPSKCPGMKLTDMKMQDMFHVSE